MPVAEVAEAFPRGTPIAQDFLPSGASVVTTPDGSVCVVSRKIEVAQSQYVNANGLAVAFDTVRRSVAASVQAMGGEVGAPVGFRIQMKYSFAPDRPVWLDPGDGAGRVDVAAMREPSTDSLHLTGPVAARLAAAMTDVQKMGGQGARLEAWSAETGRDVTDNLPALDMAALADCRRTLAAGDTDPGPSAHYLTLAFMAEASPMTQATIGEMRACAMTPTDRPVYLGRLTRTTGFFAQTDKVFVTFDDAGKPAQVYVPGILDAGFAANGVGDARISIAADSNAPQAENRVKGCLGAAAAEMCRYPAGDGSGDWVLHPCGMMSGGGLAALPDGLSGGGAPGPASLTSGLAGRVPPGSSSGGGGSGGVPPGTIITDVDGGGEVRNPPPAAIVVTVDPPVPVPLPAAGWLILAGLGGLAIAARRR